MHFDPKEADDDIRPEYDFSGGKRGVAYRPLDQGYTIRIENADGTVTVLRIPPTPKPDAADGAGITSSGGIEGVIYGEGGWTQG